MMGNKSFEEQYHDLHLEDIVHRLENDFIDWKKIGNNEEYGNNGVKGEIDVYAINCRPFDGSRLVLFEYKNNNFNRRRHKAIEQLERAEAFYERRGYRVSKFYCYGDPIKYELIS